MLPPTCGWGKKGGLNDDGTLLSVEQVQQQETLGYSRGGFSTKIHLRCDGNGLPMAFVLTAGQQHETTVFEMLMETGSVPRANGGRPRLRPRRVAADKGYSSRSIRTY
jgi:hypothetical protein